MSYAIPSAAQLKARYPRFAAVADDVVAQAITEGSGWADDSWAEIDYQPAVMLYAAHTMTLDGLGTGAESAMYGNSMQAFDRIKSASLELWRSNPKTSGTSGTLDATSYGLRYLDLLARNRGGPIVATPSAVKESKKMAGSPKPSNLSVSLNINVVQLTWRVPTRADFLYLAVYRAPVAQFDAAAAITDNLTGSLGGIMTIDDTVASGSWWYWIVATNSDAAAAVTDAIKVVVA